ncbi:MAG: DegT/DnrJ/EryC1/StrS aminotransferase family protein [Candidatus Kapabacteria bacterium]|nr:DegT/DnrJ/EryC1/StrS aminotransferase family protein [Candidatus Kapabacteria bacterium]
MNFIDLHSQYNEIKEEIQSSILKVLEHGAYIMGPEVAELESALAKFAGTKYALSCASGTDALLMPLMAWDIKPGDAVFTSPFTFIATAEVVQLLGATSVFVDINPQTYNIDTDKLIESIEKVKADGKLTPKAIIPVDLFGLCADYDKIEKIASDYGLLVLEDAAQSFGAEYNGRKAGSFGHCAATSFYPAKPLGCYGDGGAIFTDDDELYNILTSIRVHGQGEDKYNNVRIGINGRLDTLQAAILLAKLKLFESEIQKRNRAASLYNELLGDTLVTPSIPDDSISVWAQYSVLARNSEHRTHIMSHLKTFNIPSVIYYPKPLHLQTAFENLNYRIGDFPVTEDIASRIFSLPMHPYLKDEEIIEICKTVKSA